MEHLSLVRFIWISIIVISIALMTESISENPYCSCRPINECLDEIRNNSKDSQFVTTFSLCESSNGIMIKCCTFLHTAVNDFFLCASQNNLKEQVKCTFHNTLRTMHLIKRFRQRLPMMKKSEASNILPSFVNYVHSEYIGPISDATELTNTESDNFKKIDVDALQAERYTTPATRTNRILSPVADAIYSDDFKTRVTKTNLIDNFLKKVVPIPIRFIKTNVYSSLIPVENARYVQSLRDKIDGNPCATKREIYLDKNKKYPPQKLINDATNFERIEIYPQNRRSNASKGELTQAANIDGTRLNPSINTNCRLAKELLEFDENVETNARCERKSTISTSTSKDIPATPAINSLEQKTSSETFLSLDRISTRPINKNTPTNKSEAPRNDDDINNVFTIVKRNPLFSGKARKNNKPLVISEINLQPIRDSRNNNKLREGTNGDHREILLVENTAGITSMPRRDDPLQASTRNKRMTAPIVSQKDIPNKNTEKAGYKNNAAPKKNTKRSLQNNQSEVTVEETRKDSTNVKTEGSTNRTKNSANATAETLPVQKYRFPSKILPVRFNKPLKEERNSSSVTKFRNLNRFSSSYFEQFYKAKEELLSRINNMTVSNGKIKFGLLSNASQAYLLSMKKNIKALQNSEEKSMLAEKTYNNDTSSSTPKNNSKVSSEVISYKRLPRI